MSSISRVVGHRLSQHLPRLVPLFVNMCGDPDDEEMQSDEMNEVRESCLPGLETFILRCPNEVIPYIGTILDTALTFISYDPNYNYDDVDDDDDMCNDDDDDDEEEYEEDYGGSDDDDTSWKVRKASVKMMRSIITARPEMIGVLVKKCASVLVSRFKDREPSVRLDIITCLTTLLKAAGVSASTATVDYGSSGSDQKNMMMTVTQQVSVMMMMIMMMTMMILTYYYTIHYTALQMDPILKASVKLLKSPLQASSGNL